jgi:methylmalonyl-CoA/ethylmalonyl-CoA epimerase
MLTQIDHVGLAVVDLDKAISLYADAFQAEVCARERNESQGLEIVFLRIGGSAVELLATTSPDSIIGKFLAKRGQALHHVAFRVENLRECMRSCALHGLRLIDEEPRQGSGGSSIAFVHPDSAMGVLIELVERSDGQDGAA